MSIEGNRFDQFGNLIGDESDDDEDEINQVLNEGPNSSIAEIKTPVVVLPQDKEFYPPASEVYPEYTTVKHEDEDRQDYTEPILPPPVHRVIAQDLTRIPPTTFSQDFLESLLQFPQTTRNICFVGSLGHGKTEFIDALVRETHPGILETCLTKRDITNVVVGEGRRLDHLGYTDRLFLEKRRKMSISTEVVTLVDQTLYGKSIALNLIDTPGHPDFIGEVKAGLSLCDGVAFCVDVVEGLTEVSKRLLKTVAHTHLPVLLVLTKIDRLILEMKLPTSFAKEKLKFVIEQVNTILSQATRSQAPRLSPERRNVIFSSAQFSLCFSTESIAQMYNRKPDRNRAFQASQEGVEARGGRREDAIDFASRLWEGYRFRKQEGDIIYTANKEFPETFVAFALEPLYKVITHVLSMEPWEWSKKLQIPLSNSELSLNSAPLLRIALSRVFGSFGPFVLAAHDFLPPPQDITLQSSHAKTVAYATKFNPSTNGTDIFAYARVFRGELKDDSQMIALTDFYRENNETQMVNITSIEISGCRYARPISKCGPGMIVRLKFSEDLRGPSTLTDVEEFQLPDHRLLSLQKPLLKVAIEPFEPLEKKEMRDAMDKACLCHAGLEVRAHGNGEHNLIGTGELFLDCVLYDIRTTFSDIEIKVSDPFVVFNESVDREGTQIVDVTFDDKVLGFVAMPINAPVQQDIDVGRLSHGDVPSILVQDGVDEMRADGYWALGPDSAFGPNLLIDDTLPPKDDALPKIRHLIESAFNWATLEGPLCDEPMRGVMYRIVKAELGNNMDRVQQGTVIPKVLKALKGAFLSAKPILLEPVYTLECLVPQETAQIIREIIEKRRGVVLKTQCGPVPGTSFQRVMGKVPLMDSLGIEVDMKMRTLGKAFPLMFFSEWKKVTGDPLDTSIKLRPLEIASKEALAREFVVKSRRRKGLPDDVDMAKFLSDEQLIELASLVVPAPQID